MNKIPFVKKLAWSLLAGVVAWLVSAYSSVDYVEGLYAQRVAKGGDPAFTGLGFSWLLTTIGFGFFVSALVFVGLLFVSRHRV